jgi:hypothetical protein
LTYGLLRDFFYEEAQLSNLDNNLDSSHQNHLPKNIKICIIKLAASSSSSCYVLTLQHLFFIPH